MEQKKQVALIALHGLGVQKQQPYLNLLEQILKQMGNEWQNVSFHSIDFADHLPKHQQAYLQQVEDKMGRQALRQYLVGGFGDSACLQVGKAADNSPYARTQRQIRKTLEKIYQEAGRAIPVVAICQAFAGHALSNYVWDAQQKHPRFGIWQTNNHGYSYEQEQFYRLHTLSTLITTGCNIPLFVAGYNHVEPFRKPCKDFRWINFLDKHDPLAWPLKPLSPAYDKLVEDRYILPEAHNVLELAQRETPWAHEMYWEDSRVARTVVAALHRGMQGANHKAKTNSAEPVLA